MELSFKAQIMKFINLIGSKPRCRRGFGPIMNLGFSSTQIHEGFYIFLDFLRGSAFFLGAGISQLLISQLLISLPLQHSQFVHPHFEHPKYLRLQKTIPAINNPRIPMSLRVYNVNTVAIAKKIAPTITVLCEPQQALIFFLSICFSVNCKDTFIS